MSLVSDTPETKYVVMYANSPGYKGLDLFLGEKAQRWCLSQELRQAKLFDTANDALVAATQFPYATALPAPGHEQAKIREVRVCFEETRRLGKVV